MQSEAVAGAAVDGRQTMASGPPEHPEEGDHRAERAGQVAQRVVGQTEDDGEQHLGGGYARAQEEM